MIFWQHVIDGLVKLAHYLSNTYVSTADVMLLVIQLRANADLFSNGTMMAEYILANCYRGIFLNILIYMFP